MWVNIIIVGHVVDLTEYLHESYFPNKFVFKICDRNGYRFLFIYDMRRYYTIKTNNIPKLFFYVMKSLTLPSY